MFVCANSDSTEKFEPMSFGSDLQPCVFKKKTGSQLGLDCYANKNSWMTAALFHNWLKCFDYYFSSSGRRVLLFIDNFSAHGSIDTTPTLENLEIYFLPRKTTSGRSSKKWEYLNSDGVWKKMGLIDLEMAMKDENADVRAQRLKITNRDLKALEVLGMNSQYIKPITKHGLEMLRQLSLLDENLNDAVFATVKFFH